MDRPYARMSALELVAHVASIPDASELSQALAGKLCASIEVQHMLSRELSAVREQLYQLRLDVSDDKLEAYREIVERRAI